MKIPAQVHEIFCPKCGARIEFPLFMASFYDYATYQEVSTQTVLRVDLEGVHRNKLSIENLLENYSKSKLTDLKNHKWINLQDTKFCQRCGARFLSNEGKNARFCFEDNLEVDTLP